MKSPSASGNNPPGFNDFIAEWRRSRLSGLSKTDLEAVAEELATELSQAALERGHRAALSSACMPYRSMVEYVRALHDVQDTNHFED